MGIFRSIFQSKDLADPWRQIDWGTKEQLLKFVRNYKADKVDHVRVLLCGPVGAGKSSFINSVASIIVGGSVNIAESNASNTTTSFTVEYRTHSIRLRDEDRRKIPIVFSDIMGLQSTDDGGIHPDDVILALKGHVRDGYKFQTNCKLSEQNEMYNPHPSINDRAHVLVYMLDGNSTVITQSLIKKMKLIREAARDQGIPQVAVLTHIDKVCEEIFKDVKCVFKNRSLKQKTDELSTSVGISAEYIFPVWNNHEGKQKDDVDTLTLTALKHILNYVNDYIDARLSN